MTAAYWDLGLDTEPWDQVLEWQRRQMPSFLSELMSRSPWHAKQLEGLDPREALDPSAWSEVPTMSKDDLRRAQGMSDQWRLGAAQATSDADIDQVIASSGTTGYPTFFGVTSKDRQMWENTIANMFYTAGVRQDSVVAHAVAMPMVAGGMAYAEAIRRIGATLVWVGGQTPSRMADIIYRLGVDTILSTASHISFLGGRIGSELGIDVQQLNVRTLIGGGEPGLGQPDRRSSIRELWGAARVSETMGLGDVVPGMWGECQCEGGMHFTAARGVFVELIDSETGRAVEWRKGATGELVYTTFDRQAMPVIRYRSRDHVQVLAEVCECGRTAPRIRCIGRTDDMLLYKGMNVFPNAIRDIALSAAAADITGMMRIRKQFDKQVNFSDPIPLELEVKSGSDASLVKTHIEEQIRQRLRVRVHVEPTAEGKLPVGQYKNSLTYVAYEE